MPDLTGGFELSRDADKIVTAVEVRVVCRHCGYWSAGSYAGALASRMRSIWGIAFGASMCGMADEATSVGAAADETVVVAPVTVAAPELAWSTLLMRFLRL
jgi:hypothetical protein